MARCPPGGSCAPGGSGRRGSPPIGRHRPHNKMPLHREPCVGLAVHQLEEPLRRRVCGSHPPLGPRETATGPRGPERAAASPTCWARVSARCRRRPRPGTLPCVVLNSSPRVSSSASSCWERSGLSGRAGQQRQAFAQGRDRFVMGIPPGGVVSRLLRIADGVGGGGAAALEMGP